MKDIKTIALIIAGVVAFCLIMYGCYWVVKSVSYTLFYEDMVQETVREMVRANALK